MITLGEMRKKLYNDTLCAIRFETNRLYLQLYLQLFNYNETYKS